MSRPRGQTGLDAKVLASASASSIWPRPGLGLVNLASKKMCYPMQNNISCIHFVVVSLQHSLQRRGYALWCESQIRLCVAGIVAMCSYWEISTCDQPRPRTLGLGLSLSLDVLASFNITEDYTPYRLRRAVVVWLRSLGYSVSAYQTEKYLL